MVTMMGAQINNSNGGLHYSIATASVGVLGVGDTWTRRVMMSSSVSF